MLDDDEALDPNRKFCDDVVLVLKPKGCDAKGFVEAGNEEATVSFPGVASPTEVPEVLVTVKGEANEKESLDDPSLRPRGAPERLEKFSFPFPGSEDDELVG